MIVGGFLIRLNCLLVLFRDWKIVLAVQIGINQQHTAAEQHTFTVNLKINFI